MWPTEPVFIADSWWRRVPSFLLLLTRCPSRIPLVKSLACAVQGENDIFSNREAGLYLVGPYTQATRFAISQIRGRALNDRRNVALGWEQRMPGAELRTGDPGRMPSPGLIGLCDTGMPWSC
jgi:hypothetical protein